MIGCNLKTFICALVQFTNVPVDLVATAAGALYVATMAGVPLQVEGTDADGAVQANVPINISGIEPAAAAPYTTRIPNVRLTAGNMRQLVVVTSDGTHYISVPSQAVAVEATGFHNMLDYEAVPAAVATGQAVRQQGTAYGRVEDASFSRAAGANQVLEIAPVEYDVAQSTLRASAVLTAGFDTPVEIPTSNRKFAVLVVSFTRGAVGGSYICRVEKAVTIAGTNYWSRADIINLGSFSAGSDVQHDIQRGSDFQYVSTSANAEIAHLIIEVERMDLIRVSFRESSGLAVGTLGCYYKMVN